MKIEGINEFSKFARSDRKQTMGKGAKFKGSGALKRGERASFMVPQNASGLIG